MSKIEDVLVGKKIRDVVRIHDYLQLIFTDKAILNIYNPCEIPADDQVRGSEIMAVALTKEQLTLMLSPEGGIIIGMRDSDYQGPEAIEYIPQNKAPIIVL